MRPAGAPHAARAPPRRTVPPVLLQSLLNDLDGRPLWFGQCLALSFMSPQRFKCRPLVSGERDALRPILTLLRVNSAASAKAALPATCCLRDRFIRISDTTRKRYAMRLQFGWPTNAAWSCSSSRRQYRTSALDERDAVDLDRLVMVADPLMPHRLAWQPRHRPCP